MQKVTNAVRIFLITLALSVMSACAYAPAPQEARTETPPAPPQAQAQKIGPPTGQFAFVVSKIEPEVEELCRTYRPEFKCDFQIVVDYTNPDLVNAFQTLLDDGTPVVIFSIGLIKQARNVDELAFVLGHEAAHHLEGHIYRQYQSARRGALLLGGMTAIAGGNASAIEQAQQIGATLGARTYSKAFELEADELGTIITKAAGFDPLRGAQFFMRIPDPGDTFLGTHPPHAARLETVRRTAASF